MSALQQIEDTRLALSEALQVRDWAAIGELDLACRALMDELLQENQDDEAAIRA
ncbi:flagellar protein FliT, partial [Pseudomonas qingdaonensis]